MEKLVIFDIDGVLLNHNKGFMRYLGELNTVSVEGFAALQKAYDSKPIGGFDFRDILVGEDSAAAIKAIRAFNCDHRFGILGRYPGTDPLNGFKDLAVFAYVSSCGVLPFTIQNRIKNITNYFPDLFTMAYHLPALSSKKETLASLCAGRDLSKILYIEDTVKHIKDAVDLGIPSILVAHGSKESEVGDWLCLTDNQPVVPIAHASYELVYMVEKFLHQS